MNNIPILGIAAYSGTGKTTLLEKILPILKNAGVRTAVIKHAHHKFDIDHEGKDSYRLRKAGADQMLIGSEHRWALIVENSPGDITDLQYFLSRLDVNKLDLVLVEGFKPAEIPKIEIIRCELDNEPFYTKDISIIAIASNGKLKIPTILPLLDLNQPEQIAHFIISTFLPGNKKINSVNN